MNSTDKDIRKASWSLLNVTLSIFCAASFDFSVVTLIHTFVDEEDTNFFIVVFVFQFLAFVLLHLGFVFCIRTDDAHTQFAVQTLGSHILAFANIIFFGNLQKWHWFTHEWWRVWLLPLLAFMVMVILYRMLLCLLKCWTKTKKLKLEMHLAKITQIEAGGISIGFLIVQALCYMRSAEEKAEHRFMPVIHGHPREHKAYTVELLALLALGLLASSSLWSVCLHQKVPGLFF